MNYYESVCRQFDGWRAREREILQKFKDATPEEWRELVEEERSVRLELVFLQELISEARASLDI